MSSAAASVPTFLLEAYYGGHPVLSDEVVLDDSCSVCGPNEACFFVVVHSVSLI